MNNILENEKETLRKIDTSVAIKDFSKNDRKPEEMKAILELFDKAVNPFLDKKEKDSSIDKISNLESNNARLSIKAASNSCTIEISSLAGITKYSYNPLGVSFSLKTDLYEVVHRYRSVPDKYSSGECLYLKSDTREFEYNLTSGIIYRDRLYDNEREVRSATHDDISDIYLKMFYFVNKADEIVFDNLMDVKVSKK